MFTEFTASLKAEILFILVCFQQFLFVFITFMISDLDLHTHVDVFD